MRNSRYYIRLSSACQELFSGFSTFFRSLRRPGGLLPILLAASAGDLLIVALLVRSVKNFFQEFFVLFSFTHSELWFRSVLPSVGQLRYVTTPIPDCQALFSTFSHFSFGAFLTCETDSALARRPAFWYSRSVSATLSLFLSIIL